MTDEKIQESRQIESDIRKVTGSLCASMSRLEGCVAGLDDPRWDDVPGFDSWCRWFVLSMWTVANRLFDAVCADDRHSEVAKPQVVELTTALPNSLTSDMGVAVESMTANVTQLETLMASAPGPHGCLECEHLIFRIQAVLEGGGPQDWDEEVDLETARAEDPQSRDYWRYWRDRYGRPLHLSIPKDDIGWLRAQVAFTGARREDLVPYPRLRNCSWALDLSEEWPNQEDSDAEDEDDDWEDYSANHGESQGGARRELSPISS